MSTISTLPTTEALSAAFSKALIEMLTSTQMLQVRNLNAKETNKSICHSHDFCDANEAMIQAWQSLTSLDLDCGDDGHAELMNKAWDISKSAGFKTS